MTIEDFVLHSDDHFESHLLGNWLYVMYVCGGGKVGSWKKEGKLSFMSDCP